MCVCVCMYVCVCMCVYVCVCIIHCILMTVDTTLWPSGLCLNTLGRGT